ncbi:sn-glycerol-3-phosphate-binding periplasmic protein UgpB precursor [Legionella massiliensis]|uniref:sn-glycerol-3-phosphate-binding periplasmic protein UgpB n=1 Tax=Legionella massiliensis TaxID=1034943 RepID=A0A078L0S7_9GAMM|nr:extracellular solute-binding protein [Legionella massiliensis]CDZ78771.1 sn-glycerol-3-phosphate-binding periplasmic protein UgpB precursor [Legionella massiliensis]CEE14509.1 sn-glycerol-3-phosphate-binding periplasmic protein UgpB precursor [Legionella massiliensis]
MRLSIFIFLFCFLSALFAKPVELVMWYSLAGHTGEVTRQLVADFNRSQKDYRVTLVYKGEYTEALTSFAAAFRAKQPPALVQIFEVGTATMLHPKGIIKPVDELMQEEGLSLPKESFLPAVREFYSKENQLLAMPFNTSIPVVFYNADVLEQLGYKDDSFPQTWDGLEILAEKLMQAGYRCAYTSAYPSWIQLESFSALHGLAMVEGEPRRANYNNQAIVHHLKRLERWQKKHYFEYGGRASDATVLFTSGRCALFSQSSGSYNSLAEIVKFRLGVALLPLDTSVSKSRYNNVAGGAALWAVAGHKPEVYAGIARFFSYLAQPAVQERWHKQTGYLPLGTGGIYSQLAEKNKHPVLALAQSDLSLPGNAQDRLHLGPQNQIRIINDQAMEEIFAGIKMPKQAIDQAVEQANYMLLRFLRNTGSQ